MSYIDIFEDVNPSDIERSMGRRDANSDELFKRTLSDSRKPSLTLKLINRMRKMQSTRKLEQAQTRDILRLMYNPPSEDSGL